MPADYVGGEYVGDDIDDLVKQAGGGKARGSAPMERSSREVGKRGPLGFGAYSIATLATQTFTARVQRAFHCDRLLVTSAAIGMLITSIKIGDEEQILGGSVPAELYGTNALADVKPDDFTPAPAGLDISITLMNTSLATIAGTIGMKGFVKR
jgi:hypothetical protein